jgi:hypothetical protein
MLLLIHRKIDWLLHVPAHPQAQKDPRAALKRTLQKNQRNRIQGTNVMCSALGNACFGLIHLPIQ